MYDQCDLFFLAQKIRNRHSHNNNKNSEDIDCIQKKNALILWVHNKMASLFGWFAVRHTQNSILTFWTACARTFVTERCAYSVYAACQMVFIWLALL